jgi:pyridoxal 5'-phosphate synthase pdxS subunit
LPEPRRGAARINEGAGDDADQGRGRHGNIVEAVASCGTCLSEIRGSRRCARDELFVAAKTCRPAYELVKQVAADGKLPVVNFVAGGISTPADAALVMQLGAEGVFVGSGIFKSEDPARMANAIVQATYVLRRPPEDRRGLEGPGSPDAGHRLEEIPEEERLAVAV